jgi:translation initiation factor 2 alpha subunit (eIF-2alpha)
MKINDKSVVLNVFTVNKKEKNINISLIRENTKVFRAAFTVYILEE